MRRIPDILIASIAMCALAGPAMAQSSGSSTQGKHCYDVEVQKPKEVKDEHKITGTVAGGLVGGLLGNQVGGGSGKKIATAAGAVGGAFAGRKIQDNQQKKTETVIERRGG